MGVQRGWTQSHHSLQRKASSDQVKYKPTALARAMRSPVVHFVLLSTFFFSSQSFPTTNLQSEEPTTTPEPEPEKSLDISEATTPEPEPEPEKPVCDSEPTTSEPEPEKASDSSKRNSTTKDPTTPEPEPEPEKAYNSSKTTSSTTEPTTTPEPEPQPEKAVNPSETTKEPTASPESEPEPEKSFDTSSSTHEPTTLPEPEPKPTHVYSTKTKLNTEQNTTFGTTPTTKPENSDDLSTTYYTCMTCMTETTTTKQQNAETAFDPPTRIPSTRPEISAASTKEVTNGPDPERTPKKRSELAIKKMPETMFEELVARASRFARYEIPEEGVRRGRKASEQGTNCETCVSLEQEFDENLRIPSIGTKLVPFEATDATDAGWFDGGVPELSSKFQRPRGARFNPGLTQRIRPIPIIPRPRSPKTNLEPRPRSPKTNLRPRKPRKQTESTSSSLWANLAWLGKTLYQYLSVSSSSVSSTTSSTTIDTGMKQIGSFVELHHGVAGDVFALDEGTIVIKNFVYNGQGPDAFLLAGTSGQPSKGGEVVFPIPNDDGRTYAYTDKDIPILGRFTGDEDVVLRMPPGRRVSDLKWLSVWCREYAVDFGHTGIDA